MRSRAGIKETAGRVQSQSLYDRDFAAWVEQQVELLRSSHTAALDVENLIEELEGLTRRDGRALGAQLKRIMAHLLKQRHQPERAARSWEDRSRTVERKSRTSWSRARACDVPCPG